MKFRLWRRLRTVETQYAKSLNILCDMFEKIAKSCKGNQEEYVSKMNKFQESDAFYKYIYTSVNRMVTPLMVGNEKTWREAARKATKGKKLYRLLMEEVKQNNQYIFREQIVENVNLIKTLPHDTAEKVVNDIVENALKGKRAKSIEKVIVDSTNQHSRASARLIARTEVSKTTTALTKARSENLGLNWYIWRTALDGDRVRKSHRNMEPQEVLPVMQEYYRKGLQIVRLLAGDPIDNPAFMAEEQLLEQEDMRYHVTPGIKI